MKLFVYGTLKRGYGNNTLLRTSEYLGEAYVRGTLYDLGAFPALKLDDKNIVKGELYEIDEHTLKAIDYLEGYPSFYDRAYIKTLEGVKCYVYHMHNVEGRGEIKEWPNI